MSSPITRHFLELGYTVVATVDEYRVYFRGFEIAGTEMDGTTPVYGTDFRSELPANEPYFSGYVKWDGCSDWEFDEQKRCMLHGCTRDNLVNLGLILAACWDMTAELLPKWDQQGQ